jgi:hypothetical protein
MAFIGNQPTAVPLTSSQLADGLITTDKLATDAVTSAKIADGAIVNVDVNSTAAVAYSKLNLATSIVNGDIANATIALAKLSATGTPSASTFLRGDNSWASAGAAAGQVIQVVTATDSTRRTTTSTSFVTASNTLSVSITPSSASNKVLVLLNTGAFVGGDNECVFTIDRSGTNLGTANGGFGGIDAGSDGVSEGGAVASVSYLDSPATTSSITYQVYFKRGVGNGTVALNSAQSSIATLGSIIVLEIKG